MPRALRFLLAAALSVHLWSALPIRIREAYAVIPCIAQAADKELRIKFRTTKDVQLAGATLHSLPTGGAYLTVEDGSETAREESCFAPSPEQTKGTIFVNLFLPGPEVATRILLRVVTNDAGQSITYLEPEP